MSKPSLRTAEELCTLIDSHLANMSPREQQRFWSLMADHPQNWVSKRVTALVAKTIKRLGSFALETLDMYAEDTSELKSKLKKHRRPAKNADRDAEIMKLHGEGKTAGEIVLALRDRYQLTDKNVNAVISRERRKPKPE